MLSEERQTHFAHIIVDGLYKENLLECEDKVRALRSAKRAIQSFLSMEVEIDKKVCVKIRSLKRGVLEGTDEWNILYQKYFEEERQRRGE